MIRSVLELTDQLRELLRAASNDRLQIAPSTFPAIASITSASSPSRPLQPEMVASDGGATRPPLHLAQVGRLHIDALCATWRRLNTRDPLQP